MKIKMAELRKFAESRWPEVIETTLLGRVDWRVNSSGEYESVIPEWIVLLAREHDMEVLTADWKRNAYFLRFVPHNAGLTQK